MNKKKIIEKVVISSVIAICAGVGLGQVISSKIEYDNYRHSLEEAENSRVGNPVLDSISVKLKDGINYFKNGKASPNKDDFEVTANFTVKNGEDFTSNLTSKQFSMEVSEDFADKGGEIKFVYQKMEAIISVSLKDVFPTGLKVTKNPYIVCYEEGKTFDPTGMVVDVLYNDGETLSIEASKLVVDTITPLKATDKSWNVSYKFNDVTLNGKVDISVFKVGEFSNGNLLEISVLSGKGVSFADEPRSNSNLDDLVVMGRFDSGNYIKINKDQYDIVDKESIVDFGKEAKLEICAKNNKEVYCKVDTDIVKRNKIENATITSGKVLTAMTYNFVNNAYIPGNSVTYAGDLIDGSSLKFKFESKDYVRANLKLRVASNYLLLDGSNYHTEELVLNKLLKVTVNNAEKTISNEAIIERVGNSNNKNIPSQVYYDVILNNAFIKSGSNIVTLSIKDSGLRNYDGSMASININYLDVVMLDDKSINLGEYNQIVTNDSLTRDVTANMHYETDSKELRLANQDVQGGCSDGKFGYFAVSEFGGSKTKIVKFDFEDNSIVKVSDNVVNNYKSGWMTDGNHFNKMFYENGKVGIFTFDNKVTYYDSNTLGLLEKDVAIGSNSIDASYNQYLGEYVVVDKLFNVKFYNENHTTTVDKGVNLSFKKTNYVFRTVTSDNDYIYVLYRDKDESITNALVEMYDWNGNKIGDDLVIDCSIGLTASTNRTVQNMVFVNGTTYIVGRAYSGTKKGMFASKLSMSLNEFKTFNTSLLGGYVQDAMKKENELSFTNQILSSKITLKKKYNETDVNLFSVEGGCTDGTYLYYALTSNGRQYVTIAKYDLETKQVVDSSDVLKISDSSYWTEDCNLFYKDGYIYLILNKNSDMKVFNAKTLTLESEEKPITFSNGTTNYSKVDSLGYNSYSKQYVFSASNKMYITDKDKKVTSTIQLTTEHTKDFFKDFALDTGSGAKFQTLYADDEYIYALFNHNAWLSSEIQIFDWTGKKIKTVTIDLNMTTDLEKAKSQYNVQNLIELNGKLYLGTLSYGGSQGLYLYEVSYN